MPRLRRKSTSVPVTPRRKHASQKKEEDAEKKRLKRLQETPEEAERRRERDREQKRARRALLKEHLPPDALQHKRAREYENTLKKRYQNDDKIYNGSDGLPGETVGDRRRRLEAQRVRERREKLKLMKQAQAETPIRVDNVNNETGIKGQPQGQGETALPPVNKTSPGPKPVGERVKSKLHRRIVSTIYRSIETKEERQLMYDARCGKLRDKRRKSDQTPSADGVEAFKEEELHFKRFFVAQLESDFMAEKRSLVNAALELELGSGIPIFDEAGNKSVPAADGTAGSEGKGQSRTGSVAADQQSEFGGVGVGVVVKIEEESDGELQNIDDGDIPGGLDGDEETETVQDWLARLYTTEDNDDQGIGEGSDGESIDGSDTPRRRRRSRRQGRRTSNYLCDDSDDEGSDDGDEFEFEYQGIGGGDEDEENFGPRPTPQQLRQQKEKIFKLKMECMKRARFRKLQSLQEAVESARTRWVAEAGGEEEDERRAIVDADRESMIERIYAEKRSLIEIARTELSQKRLAYSQESEEERKARIAAAYSAMEEEILANSTKTPKGRNSNEATKPRRTPSERVKKQPADTIPLDPVAQKASMAAKGRVRVRMLKAESAMYKLLQAAVTSYDQGSHGAALEKFESILTTGENPRVIQFGHLVRIRKGKQPEEVLTYRKILYTHLSKRMSPLLTLAPCPSYRSGAYAKVPLYQRLFPEKGLLDGEVDLNLTLPPELPPPQLTPVSAQQSHQNFLELRDHIRKTGERLGQWLKVKAYRPAKDGSYAMLRADKERHEHYKALRRKAHAKKKFGIDIELGSYLRRNGGTPAKKYDVDGNEIVLTRKPRNSGSETPKRPRKKKADPDFEYQYVTQHQHQGQYQSAYSTGSGPVSVGGGSSCDYSAGGGGHGQHQNQDPDDDDFGWLPMGSGVQLSSLLTAQQHQQQLQAHSSNHYSLRLVGDTTGAGGYSQPHQHSSHRNQQQQFFNDPHHQQQQQAGWNLSHQNQPHSSSQWSTIAFPNPISNLNSGGWNSSLPASHAQGHQMYHQGQGHGRRRAPSPDQDDGSDYAPSPNPSSDSDGDVGVPNYQLHQYPSSTPNKIRGRGRPRKGEEKKKSRKTVAELGRAPRRGGKPMAIPSILAAEVELPPLNQNPAEVLPLMMDNAELVMRDIVPACPYCQEVLVGPFELEKHIKKLHPGKPLPSKMPSTSTPTAQTEEAVVAAAVASIEGEQGEGGGQQGVAVEKDSQVGEVELSERAKTVLSLNNQEELKFSCKVCPTQYKNPFSLIEHTFTVHYPGKLYECPISRRMSDQDKSKSGASRCAQKNVKYDRLSMRLHLQRVHAKESGTWTMGINSINKVNRNSKFLCLHCDHTCTSYTALLEHYEETHGKVRYGCQACGIYLRENDHLVDHVRIFHPETPMSGPPRPLEVDPTKSFLCKICFSEFSSQEFLASHRAEGHGFLEQDKSKSIRLTCRGKGCGRQTISDKRMEEHERNCSVIKADRKKKTGDAKDGLDKFDYDEVNREYMRDYFAAPYKCEICRFSYLSLGTLRLHSIHIHKIHKFFHEIAVEKGIPLLENPDDVENHPTSSTASNNMDGSLLPSFSSTTRKTKKSLTISQDEILNSCDPALYNQQYTCTLCPYNAPANIFHAIHLGYDAYLKRYCAHCQKVYSQPFLLVNHNESAHGMDAEATRQARGGPVGKEVSSFPEGALPAHWHSCQVCHRGFTPQEFHIYHTLFQQGLGARRCGACDKIYLSYYTLRKHMVMEHGATMGRGQKTTGTHNPPSGWVKMRGPSAGGGVKRQLQEEDFAKLFIATEVKKSQGSMTVYTCKVCLSGFKTENFIRAHIASAHQDDAFTRVFCTKCNSTFACRDNLLKHEKVVHVEKTLRFKCPFCPEIFQRLLKLKQHSRDAHPGQAFSWNDAEKIHVEEEVLPGAPVYECNFCAVIFKTKDSMKLHVTSKHFSVHFTTFCEHCGLQIHGSKLKQHMQSSHSEYLESYVSKRKSGPVGIFKEQARLTIHQVLQSVKEVYDRMDELGLGDFRPGQIMRQRGELKFNQTKTGKQIPLGGSKRTRKSYKKGKKGNLDEKRRSSGRSKKKVKYDDTESEEESESEEMELGSDNDSSKSRSEVDSQDEDAKIANLSTSMKERKNQNSRTSSRKRTHSKNRPRSSSRSRKTKRGRKVSRRKRRQSSDDEDGDSSTGQYEEEEERDYGRGVVQEDQDPEGDNWMDMYIKPELVYDSDPMDDEYPGECIFPDAIGDSENELQAEISPAPEIKTEQKRRPGPASKTKKSIAVKNEPRRRRNSGNSSDFEDQTRVDDSDSLDNSDDDDDFEASTRRRSSRNGRSAASSSSRADKRRQTRSSTSNKRPNRRRTQFSSSEEDTGIESETENSAQPSPVLDCDGVEARVVLKRCDVNDHV